MEVERAPLSLSPPPFNLRASDSERERARPVATSADYDRKHRERYRFFDQCDALFDFDSKVRILVRRMWDSSTSVGPPGFFPEMQPLLMHLCLQLATILDRLPLQPSSRSFCRGVGMRCETDPRTTSHEQIPYSLHFRGYLLTTD